MKTVEQLNTQIAVLKQRPKTDSVQQRIEHLERERNVILSADRKDLRKLRSRALYIIGSTVSQAAEDSNEQAFADWLRQRVFGLPDRDRDLVRSAFPQIFSGSSSTHAERSTAGGAGCLTHEGDRKMSDDRDFYADADYIDDVERDEPVDCALYEHPALFFHGLLPGETADANGRPILPSIELIAGIHKRKETHHE